MINVNEFGSVNYRYLPLNGAAAADRHRRGVATFRNTVFQPPPASRSRDEAPPQPSDRTKTAKLDVLQARRDKKESRRRRVKTQFEAGVCVSKRSQVYLTKEQLVLNAVRLHEVGTRFGKEQLTNLPSPQRTEQKAREATRARENRAKKKARSGQTNKINIY